MEMRPIKNFPQYLITEDGRVFSKRANRFLKAVVQSNGYTKVSLPDRRDYSIHRLVAEAWIGKSDLQINHKNGIRNDNRVENLEYVTGSQNQRHRFDVLKKRRTCNKLTEDQVREIRKRTESCAILGKEYKVHHSTIWLIKKRIQWKHVE